MDGAAGSGSALDRTPLLGFEPFIDVAAAESPVLPHLGGWDAAVLRQGIKRRLRDLQIEVKLLKRQDIRLGQMHWPREVSPL